MSRSDRGAGDPGGQAIVPDVRRQASFECRRRAGISDPVDLDVPALANISISLFSARRSQPPPMHWDGHETAFIVKGDQTGEADFKSDSTIVSRLFVSEVMVDAAPRRARRRGVRRFDHGTATAPPSTATTGWPNVVSPPRLVKAGAPRSRPQPGDFRRQGAERPHGRQRAGAFGPRRAERAHADT